MKPLELQIVSAGKTTAKWDMDAALHLRLVAIRSKEERKRFGLGSARAWRAEKWSKPGSRMRLRAVASSVLALLFGRVIR
jgi:hypothetical protein